MGRQPGWKTETAQADKRAPLTRASRSPVENVKRCSETTSAPLRCFCFVTNEVTTCLWTYYKNGLCPGMGAVFEVKSSKVSGSFSCSSWCSCAWSGAGPLEMLMPGTLPHSSVGLACPVSKKPLRTRSWEGRKDNDVLGDLCHLEEIEPSVDREGPL